MKKVTVKIGRHEYEITKNDIFMDNRVCVQLLTQSKDHGEWGGRPNQCLSKRVVKELEGFAKIPQKHSYTSDVDVCRLDT